MSSQLLTNRQVSELLALTSEAQEPGSTKARALRRAARAALTWPVEASTLLNPGQSLEELPKVGPYVAKVLEPLLSEGQPTIFAPLRDNFLTRTQVDRTLAAAPNWGAGMRCDLQMHTTWTDGYSSLDEMVGAADLRGYSHIAITDHSQGLAIAHGMNEAQLAAQGEAIAGVNAGLGERGSAMKVLHGIEMNISPDGTGDMDSTALAELDIVLGAFHSKLRLTDDQTGRYLAAVNNPDIHVLAHPRGRIFNFRAGLQCDWRAVFTEAARLDKAVEIDGIPDRQDLSLDLLALARETGVRISMGSDAHHHTNLGDIEFAWAAALRAGIDEGRIINRLPLDELLAWTRPGRK